MNSRRTRHRVMESMEFLSPVEEVESDAGGAKVGAMSRQIPASCDEACGSILGSQSLLLCHDQDRSQYSHHLHSRLGEAYGSMDNP